LPDVWGQAETTRARAKEVKGKKTHSAYVLEHDTLCRSASLRWKKEKCGGNQVNVSEKSLFEGPGRTWRVALQFRTRKKKDGRSTTKSFDKNRRNRKRIFSKWARTKKEVFRIQELLAGGETIDSRCTDNRCRSREREKNKVEREKKSGEYTWTKMTQGRDDPNKLVKKL